MHKHSAHITVSMRECAKSQTMFYHVYDRTKVIIQHNSVLQLNI